MFGNRIAAVSGGTIKIQDLCKIMESVVYPLSKLKRLVAFPYPLYEVGLMFNHFVWHKNNRLNRYFICFAFNKEKYNSSEVDRRPSFSIIPPGTVLNSKSVVRHDELFFTYSTEVSQKLKDVFDPLPQERKSFKFMPDQNFKRDLQKIRTLLAARMTLGTADKLDALAMEMTFSMIVAAGSFEAQLETLNAEHKLEEIAEKLRRGAHLEPLIHQYGYSRRAFYYEWNRKFSMSPKQMQLEAKLQKAQCMLIGSTLSVAEIAVESGFSSHRYFHESFQRQYSCTPGEYRKRYRSSKSSRQ